METVMKTKIIFANKPMQMLWTKEQNKTYILQNTGISVKDFYVI